MATLTPSPLRPDHSGSSGRSSRSTRPGSSRQGPTRQGSSRQGSSRQGTAAWVEAALDRPLTSYHLVLAASALLLGLGVLMVLSASSVKAYLGHDGDSYYFVKRQIAFVVVGLVAIVVILRLRHNTLRVLSWFGMGLSMVMLMLTYTKHFGLEFQGNRNWLTLGHGLTLQPSEFAKLALVLWGADVLARKDKLLDQPKHLLIPYLPVAGLVVMLIVLQRDAGTAAVVIAIVACVLWMVGAPLRIFATMVGAAACGFGALIATNPMRVARFVAFLHPSEDASGINDQAQVSEYAIASGGWWGLGLGASRQKWGTLPEAHSDFIFAVIGEELGLFGSLMVLAMFLVLGYAGIRIALRSDDNFSRYAAGGITAWFGVQALINVGVVLRLLPVAGVPLPLVSYGGSALLANLLAVGVLLSCARNEPAARRLLTAKAGSRPPRMTAVVGSRSGRAPRGHR